MTRKVHDELKDRLDLLRSAKGHSDLNSQLEVLPYPKVMVTFKVGFTLFTISKGHHDLLRRFDLFLIQRLNI